MTGNRPADIWLITDSRYLRQRMPLALADWLESTGSSVRLVVADRGDAAVGIAAARSPGRAFDGLEPGDLVVARSRHPYALALLQVAEALGARPLDSSSAVLRVRNKLRCTLALARRNVPIPPTFLAHRPAELDHVPADAYPLILKPVLGDNARGLRIVRDARELGSVDWPDEFVLAQSYLDAGGVDLKVYVADDAIWAVRRPSPLSDAADEPVPARVTRTLRELVRACRAEFGLRLFGLDVLELSEGPVVVDVNEFPNYTGVAEAPAAIGRAIVEMATEGRRAAAERNLVRA
jgi:ribosomal protein S6--L-glutamate ligase